MQKHFPGSTWVLMAWGENPGDELINGIQKDNILVLELNGENQNNWAKTNEFGNIPWIWCSINNYGETTGLKGNLDCVLQDPRRSFQITAGQSI